MLLCVCKIFHTCLPFASTNVAERIICELHWIFRILKCWESKQLLQIHLRAFFGFENQKKFVIFMHVHELFGRWKWKDQKWFLFCQLHLKVSMHEMEFAFDFCVVFLWNMNESKMRNDFEVNRTIKWKMDYLIVCTVICMLGTQLSNIFWIVQFGEVPSGPESEHINSFLENTFTWASYVYHFQNQRHQLDFRHILMHSKNNWKFFQVFLCTQHLLYFHLNNSRDIEFCTFLSLQHQKVFDSKRSADVRW